MSFGWSAGDIVAALQLLNKVRNALKDSGGSKTDYQDATAFLDTFSATLSSLKDIQETSPLTELPKSISDHVERLRKEIDQFLQLQNDYGGSLGPFPTSSPFKSQTRKIQYATSKKVQSLRAKIGPELSTLQIKLLYHILLVCSQFPSVIQRQVKHDSKAALDLHGKEQDIGAILQTIESQGEKLDAFLEAISSFLFFLEAVQTDVQAQRWVPLFQRDTWAAAVRLTQCTMTATRPDPDQLWSVLQNSQQIALGLLGILRAVICLLSLAMMAGYRKAIVPFSKRLTLMLVQPSTRGIKLIDALGRRATLPYDCGRSWDDT
ncbi:hypothetical protein BDP81DRAFT_15301 [Colletotrichum phormii]|uniref:Fungal N-terminal domain-containing protein n=1 Tax=Colletotrichum phormii TaxID=359342 RepID=A0AAJ0EP43_9PEZI|nr:uncharacterized protein BDP81DRAFT_15301 [Colletotrichum phormii]KAK1656088.1 hypothetical protein BDP81DRAFT_15301 [Colletotrichum phormii]